MHTLHKNKAFVNVAKRAHDQCSILVWFNNFALTMGFYWSYTLLLKSLVLMHSSQQVATQL